MFDRPIFDRLTLTAFAASLLLAAGLLFNIQPMVGKMLLPLVGGTPAVWNVAMAFFQLSLLLGYFVAHGLSRLPAWLHAMAYVAALAIAALFLPISLPADWRPVADQYAPFQVLGLLVTSIAVPFIALSLSAPTLQRLFSATRHERAADPYFLYAASNLGSFIGLLIYPLVLEPRFDVLTQTNIWKHVYMGLIGLSVVCLLLQLLHPAKRDQTATTPNLPHSTAPSWQQRGFWVLLAAIPSSLTLGVTTYITSDVSPTPMMWVLTLGLYLLTYIFAFAKRGEKLRQFNLNYYQLLGCMSMATILIPLAKPWTTVAIDLTAFFSIALACHTLLSHTRPPSDRLTEFYFWLSLGGAIGGSFNAFLAPLVFNQFYEFPIAILLGLLVYMPTNTVMENAKVRQAAAGGMIVLILIVIACNVFKLIENDNLLRMLMVFFISSSMIILRALRVTFALAGAGLIAAMALSGLYHNRIYLARDFFGVISVMNTHNDQENFDYRVLNHGNTSHGFQIITPTPQTTPTAYYSPISPIAQVFERIAPKDVALIGLGSGALNCYAGPDSNFHFIEIDPLVVQVAKEYFTFLSDCKPPKITVGDGRLELAKLDERFDAIIIDAFSSDSIPVHVITTEAVQMYLQHLKPNGIIIAHISSRFFQLDPMLGAIAAKLDLQAWLGTTMLFSIKKDRIDLPNQWVVMAPKDRDLSALLAPATSGTPGVDTPYWTAIELDPAIRPWSDGYSNLLAVMKFSPAISPLQKPPAVANSDASPSSQGK